MNGVFSSQESAEAERDAAIRRNVDLKLRPISEDEDEWDFATAVHVKDVQ